MYEYDYVVLEGDERKYFKDAIDIKLKDGWRLHTFSPSLLTADVLLIFERVKQEPKKEEPTMRMG